MLWIVLSFYLLSSILYFIHLWVHSKRASSLGIGILGLGVAAHTVSLVLLYLESKTAVVGLDRSLSFFAWLIALVYIVSQIRLRTPVLGAFVAPLALLMTLPSIILPQGLIETDPSLKNPWIFIHIILVFLGEALFTIAFMAGVLYILEERQIKSKRLGGFFMRLPSLNTLDNLNHTCLLVGFPLITVGLALGLLSARAVWGDLWHWGNKETWSLITWVLYAVLIHGRLAAGWKGRKAALGAVLGFGIIIFTFLIIGVFSPGRHDFLEIRY